MSCFTKKEEKERIKREGDREACNLSKLIQLLREKLSMSEEHPKALLSLTQLRKPAQGLNQYLGHNAEYTSTIIPVWVITDYPEAKVYLPQEVETDGARRGCKLAFQLNTRTSPHTRRFQTFVRGLMSKTTI